MSLLSSIQQEQVKAGLLALHDELSREIKIYQVDEKIIINTDENYSYAYDNTNAEVESNIVENTVKARVYYADMLLSDMNSLDANLRLKIVEGKTVIRVTDDGRKLLNSADSVTLDGKKMIVESSSKPSGNGIFNNIFWDFTLNPKTNESD